MRQKHQLSKEELKAHEQKFGGYNDLPPNMKDISFQEGVGLLTRGGHGFHFEEYRQPVWRDESKTLGWGFMGELHLVYLDDHSGFGWWREYIWKAEDKGRSNVIDGSNRYEVRFFRFGCAHEYGPDEGRFMFEHSFTCKKCGHSYSYDSSG